MTTRQVTAALSIALAAALFVGGCSSLPTSPSRGAAQPTVFGYDLPDGDSGPAPAPGMVQPVSSSVYIRAIRGGTVTAGDFSVVVPPLALTGDAIVTVRQPDPSKPEVELSVTPESRNGFRLPVTLVANCGGHLDRKLVSASYVSWWDPAAKAWVPVPHSSVSVLNLTVSAPLMHFSTYRVENGGRAGW